MRSMVRLSAFAVSTLLFLACGGRVPPEVTATTLHFVGSWIQASDLKDNVDAADGGTGTVNVLNVDNNMILSEETRVPGQPAPTADVVGRVKISQEKYSGTLAYDGDALRKLGKRSDDEINRLIANPPAFVVSIDGTAKLTLSGTATGVSQKAILTYVRMTPEQREKLKLKKVMEKTVFKAPVAPTKK